MKRPKRLLFQIQLKDFMPLREHAEQLLHKEIGFNEPKVRRIVKIVNHLKLSWELLSDSERLNDPLTRELIDLLFLNYINHQIKRITHLFDELTPPIHRTPSYHRLQTSLSSCRQKINTLALRDLNEAYVDKIH